MLQLDSGVPLGQGSGISHLLCPCHRLSLSQQAEQPMGGRCGTGGGMCEGCNGYVLAAGAMHAEELAGAAAPASQRGQVL